MSTLPVPVPVHTPQGPPGLLTVHVEVRTFIYKALFAGTVIYLDTDLENDWTGERFNLNIVG